MEQQQVIEEVVSGNKLIMEFLELDKCTDEEHRDNPCYWHEADGEYLTASQTKYHSSWDWLMPVVEKIWRSDKLVSINFYNDAKAVECKIYNWGLGDPEQEFEHTSPIRAVWQAVINQIQFMNTQTK